ncbi:transposase, partial [Clostridioides difficile]
MDYEEENNYYICTNEKKLFANKIINRKSKTGYKSEITCYICEECSNCQYKSNCIKRSNSKVPLKNRTKNLQVSKSFHEKRKENLKRIMSLEGDELRVNRSI